MYKFLLDANISPKTAQVLRNMNLDVKSVIEEGISAYTDEEIIRLAEGEGRIVITQDMVF